MMLKKEIVNIICKKYNVLEFIDLIQYDIDPENLADVLEKYYFFSFSPGEKIIILHHDTDYYSSITAVGNTIYNFFRLCANFDIDLSNIIIVTNHYGIEHEIASTARSICNSNGIKVIYTSQWYDFPSYQDINQSTIDYNTDVVSLYTCLNNQQRMHRLLTLCMLKEYDLLDKGIVSYHFKN